MEIIKKENGDGKKMQNIFTTNGKGNSTNWINTTYMRRVKSHQISVVVHGADDYDDGDNWTNAKNTFDFQSKLSDPKTHTISSLANVIFVGDDDDEKVFRIGLTSKRKM